MVEKLSNYQSNSIGKENITAAMDTTFIEIIKENSDSSKNKLREEQKNTSFYTRKIPSISVLGYLERIIKYTKMEESTLILVLVYIDKLSETSNFLLTENNIHRYFFI